MSTDRPEPLPDDLLDEVCAERLGLPVDQIPDLARPGLAAIASGRYDDVRAVADQIGEDAPDASAFLQESVNVDRAASWTALVLFLGLCVIASLACIPGVAGRTARTLMSGVGAGDAAGARALFTPDGWKAGGERFVAAFSGQSGRVFGQSQRARERRFVLVDFPGRTAQRRYLVFSAEGDRVVAVRRTTPRPDAP